MSVTTGEEKLKVKVGIDLSLMKKLVCWVVGIWFTYWILVVLFSGNPNNPGTWGDMFGGLNALFSGLAFAGVICTILLQSQELKYQREELELQRKATQGSEEALRRQADTLKETARLNSINGFVEKWEEISQAIQTELRNKVPRVKQREEAGENSLEAEAEVDKELGELRELHTELHNLRKKILINYKDYLEIGV
jgi:hypothetical protein